MNTQDAQKSSLSSGSRRSGLCLWKWIVSFYSSRKLGRVCLVLAPYLVMIVLAYRFSPYKWPLCVCPSAELGGAFAWLRYAAIACWFATLPFFLTFAFKDGKFCFRELPFILMALAVDLYPAMFIGAVICPSLVGSFWDVVFTGSETALQWFVDASSAVLQGLHDVYSTVMRWFH